MIKDDSALYGATTPTALDSRENYVFRGQSAEGDWERGGETRWVTPNAPRREPSLRFSSLLGDSVFPARGSMIPL